MALINSQVITWAAGKLTQRVGAGECWDLVESAITSSGGVSSTTLGPVGKDKDYVWGTLITPVTSLIAGDLLQFSNYSMSVQVDETITFLDDSGDTATASNPINRGYPHHSAIVESINGNTVTILEQNAPPDGRVVQRFAGLYLVSVPKVTETLTGPRQKVDSNGQPSGPMVSARIERTTTVTVTNLPKIYRAKTP